MPTFRRSLRSRLPNIILMKIRTLTPEVIKNKIVAIRVDFNVPIAEGKVIENTRITESIPTIKYILNNGAKEIHLFSHLGRPKGKSVTELSLKVVLSELEKLLEECVSFREDFNSDGTKIQLHENVRFHPGETQNDPEFIKTLLSCGAEVFINEGFAVSHRSHASVVGMASFLPAYPGFLLQKEIDALHPFIKKGKVPGLCIVIGGAKISTKIEVLKHFAETAENIVLGGALATTFLSAEGFDVGNSFYEPDMVLMAQEVLGIAEKNNVGVHTPIDVVCAEEKDSLETINVPVEDVCGNMQIFDIGNHTVSSYAEILVHSQTIIWNGPMGVCEEKNFEKGTQGVLKVVAAQKSAITILGGGDTLEVLKSFGVEKTAFSHVSTGGGAMLEFLEGKELPGIEVLMGN